MPAAVTEQIAIAGAGAVACGLAHIASRSGDVWVLARSDHSADRAKQEIEAQTKRDPGAHGKLRMTTDPRQLAGASVVIEAVSEELDVKTEILRTLAGVCGPTTLLATTTSSLSIAELSFGCGVHDRLFGLHVFNPVAKMDLIELVFPSRASDETRARATALCALLGKTAIVVPDIPGFVVNRLLLPYLMSAVELLEETQMDPQDIDRCMTLGAAHPLGPLALLDLIGLDVAAAIARSIERPVPLRLRALIADNHLGRKTGRGFFSYPHLLP